jgi:phosphoribosylformimino-5-aminoimidazole carboxamide ribotide isomerase
LEFAKQYCNMWFQKIHIIDLDGAKQKSPQNMWVVEQVALGTDLKVQVWWWIRTFEDVKKYFQVWVDRIILSSQAVKNPDFWRENIEKYWKDKFVLSLDVLDGGVKINGWLEWAWKSIDEVIRDIWEDYIKNLIVTDISKDGTLSWVNTQLYKDLINAYNDMHIIPAWWVSSESDIKNLKDIWIKELVAGRVIYEQPKFLQTLLSHM